MLNSNKTYDNSNLRDKTKTFNDGMVSIYEASERILVTKKGDFYFSIESVSYQKYTQAEQNSKTIIMSIGIPQGGTPVEHGDVAEINGEFYFVDHVQYKDYERPMWWQLYLTKPTNSYAVRVEDRSVS